jgi:hypothetical protein
VALAVGVEGGPHVRVDEPGQDDGHRPASLAQFQREHQAGRAEGALAVPHEQEHTHVSYPSLAGVQSVAAVCCQVSGVTEATWSQTMA